MISKNMMFNNFSLSDEEILKILEDYEKTIEAYSKIDNKVNEDLSQDIKIKMYKALSANRVDKNKKI